MTQDLPEPTFASPTPPGSLPAEGLGDLELPAAAQGTGAAGHPADRAGRTPSRAGGDSSHARRRLPWSASRVATVVVVLAVVGGGVASALTTAHDRAWEPVASDVAAPREANAVQLVLGSCLLDLPAGTVGRVTVVPCRDEHAAQVVGRADSAADAVWPGADALARRASASCGPDLLSPRGREVEGIEFVVLTPSAEGWEDGDRAGLCLAVPSGGAPGDLLG